MHELGLLYRVTKTVDSVMLENGLTCVSEIVLRVGEMTDVLPEYLEQAWLVARKSTRYPDAVLTIEIVPAVAECSDCGNRDSVRNFGVTCPVCDSPHIRIVSGREFEIKHIVAK